ncbi:hypothetical protein, partial [Devosia elaeis]|uniref:hypothetical protein n=1 Tax=Devosia elaeis TaxID=1770058 RepID=UPI001969A576
MTTEELSIHQRGLRSRVKRLLEGRAEAADVGHIFAGLRSNAGDHESFREIGDFAAHPDLRNRGPSTNRLKDFVTVFAPLLARASGKELPIERVLDRALANLRMLEDHQVRSRFPFKSRSDLEKWSAPHFDRTAGIA